jgi:hypothetical protein
MANQGERMNPRKVRLALACAAALSGALILLSSCDNMEELTQATTLPSRNYTYGEVYSVFARSCMPCHNSGNKPDFSDSNAVKASAARIAKAVRDGWMPTAGSVSFTPAHKALLLQWADSTSKYVPQTAGGD